MTSCHRFVTLGFSKGWDDPAGGLHSLKHTMPRFPDQIPEKVEIVAPKPIGPSCSRASPRRWRLLRPLYGRGEPAINDDLLASDVGSGIRRKKDHHAREVAR